MSMKNPVTLAGIGPATFRFVAQHLSHWATAVPPCFVILALFFKAVTASVFCKSILFVLTPIPDVCYDIRIALLLKLPIGMLH